MTHRYGRRGRKRHAATLSGMAAYMPGPKKYPGMEEVPGYPGEMEPPGKGKPHPPGKGKPYPPGKGKKIPSEGYCYLPQKNALVAKGKPAIPHVKYYGKKNGMAVVGIPGKGKVVVPFCGIEEAPGVPPGYPGEMEPPKPGGMEVPGVPPGYPYPEPAPGRRRPKRRPKKTRPGKKRPRPRPKRRRRRRRG